MPFSQAQIVNTYVYSINSDLKISWDSHADSKSCYQVYVDRVLKWQGHTRHCTLTQSPSKIPRNTWIEIGTVSPSEGFTDFSSLLASNSSFGDRAKLSWSGGTYLDQNNTDQVVGFKIFGEREEDLLGTNPPLADISAYPGSWISDGYGVGGYGEGGYGRSATTYSWTSEALPLGQWFFAIAPYDSSERQGDLGAAISLNIKSPPLSPITGSLQLIYNGSSTRRAQLTWNPRT